MKSTIIYTIILLVVIIVPSQASENKKVFSYSMEEMYQRATYFRQMREGKDLDSADKYLKAAEFKGYIASLLDYSEDYNQCAIKYPVNDIAMRTAIIISSNPLNRSNIASINVLVGLSFACDESKWNKWK